MNWKNVLILSSATFVIGVLLGWGLTWNHYRNIPTKEIVLTDTVTVTKERIVEKTKYVTQLRVDTIRDTIMINGKDTIINFPIPISQYTYEDTIRTDTTTSTIRIDYSGYKTQLDGVQYSYTYYPKIPVQKKKKGQFGQFVGLGVQVGYGLGISNPVKFEPYVGVGIMYGWGYSW